jgi:dTDP-glucose 4,6-dehydratase
MQAPARAEFLIPYRIATAFKELPVPALPADDLDHILRHTRDLWQEARGRSFFITGGTGFFGTWLLESFLAANEAFQLNAEAVVLSRNPNAFLERCPHLRHAKALTWVQGDVRDFPFLPGNFDFVVHAATDTSAGLASEQPIEIVSTILDGTKRVLQFASACQARKFLLTSSGAVYGPQPGELSHIPEAYTGAPDCLSPTAAYGEGKRAAELLCILHANRFEVKLARCFAFVGPGLPLDAHFAIGNFIRDALAGNTILIQGDGTPRRSYLYASDLAIWLWSILFRAPSCRAFNVGSDRSISIAELAEAVRQAVNRGSEIRTARKPAPGAVALQYVPSVQRAEQELGLRQYIGLEEAIRKTSEWYSCVPLPHTSR